MGFNLQLLSSRKYKDLVTYIQGSPMDKRVLLERARVDKANACIILAPESADKSVDANNRLYYLAVKHANVKIPTLIQIGNEDQRAKLELQGRSDSMYLIGQIQACLAGKACTVPGITTLILNLLTADASELLPDVEPGSWEDDYLKGNGEEIYPFKVPNSFMGLTFADAACILYEEYHLILIAIRVPMSVSGKTARQYVLNPGRCYRLRTGDKGFLIAANDDAVASMYRMEQQRAQPRAGYGKEVSKEDFRRQLSVQRVGPSMSMHERNFFATLAKKIIERHDDGSGVKVIRDIGDEDTDGDDAVETAELLTMQSRLNRSLASPTSPCGSGFKQVISMNICGTSPMEKKGKNDGNYTKAERERDERLDLYETLQRMVRNKWCEVYDILSEPRDSSLWYFDDISPPPTFMDHVLYIGPTNFIPHFLCPLRSHTAAIHPVVVILCETRPNVDIMHSISLFDEVYVVIGNPGNHVDLLRAGANVCAQVTYMSDKSKVYKDHFLADMNKVFMARSINEHNSRVYKKICEAKEKGHVGPLRPPIDSSFEFRYFRSVVSSVHCKFPMSKLIFLRLMISFASVVSLVIKHMSCKFVKFF